MTHILTPLQPAKSRKFSRPSAPLREPLLHLRHYPSWGLPCSLPVPQNLPRRAAVRYLTEAQGRGAAAGGQDTSRNPHRDATLILVAYRHGLRVSELIDIRWDDVHLDRAEIYVRRLKGGKSSMQPIEGDELRALRRLRRENPTSPFLFVSELRGPLSRDAVQYMLRRAGEAAGLPHVHPHMLRHACGYELVNSGVNTRTIQDYLGHRDVRHTELYTQVDASRFRGLWRTRGR